MRQNQPASTLDSDNTSKVEPPAYPCGAMDLRIGLLLRKDGIQRLWARVPPGVSSFFFPFIPQNVLGKRRNDNFIYLFT